jgi:pyridoxamine 5'-phosphate oxidase
VIDTHDADGEELDRVLEQSWRAIEVGSLDSDSMFHTAIVSSTGLSGPGLRTVVLRHVNRETRSLVFHTDSRSSKVAEIELCSQINWLFYDPACGIQIRANSAATIHHDNDVAVALWKKIPANSRENYAHPIAPGMPLTSEDSPLLLEEQSRLNFMVVDCKVTSIDWLKITEQGNLRAQFTWQEQSWKGVWVAP